MKYEKIITTEAYDLSPHNHAFINPYNGCSMGCPFCYWLSKDGWENRIQIKTNIPEVLEAKLREWPKDKFIYLGSVCDPFNELEEAYGLSKKCLELISKYEVPLLITTSAINEAIISEIEVLKNFRSRVVIVVELARIPEIRNMKMGGLHAGIVNANRLKAEGLEVWSTLAPICPGIIEAEAILTQLDEEIPIYVDSLQCTPESIQGARIRQWIQAEHPDLLELYDDIIMNGNTEYFPKVLEKYKNNSRIKTFPFELD